MTLVSSLVSLQETDTALDARRAELSDAESRLGETEELLDLRVRVDELRASLRAAQGEQKDVELEADGLRAKITPAEEKLYSGAIKNPKELADLQADVDQLKRHLSMVEDRDLEALTAVEQAQAGLTAAEGEQAGLETSWSAEQADLTSRIAALRSEIGELERERAERAGYVEGALLQTYDHVRRAHQGRGVAKLDRNLCLGCRITVPVSTLNRARAGVEAVQCPNCERILYT